MKEFIPFSFSLHAGRRFFFQKRKNEGARPQKEMRVKDPLLSFSLHAIIRNLSNTINYVCKKGSYISNTKNLYQGTLMPVEKLLGNVADNEGIDMALQFLNENQLKLAMGSKA